MNRGRFKTVVGVRPTGWTFAGGATGRGGWGGGARGGAKGEGVSRALGVTREEKGPLVLYGVPYSEHSSFPEMRAMVELLRPGRVVPTVNARNPQRRAEMLALLAAPSPAAGGE